MKTAIAKLRTLTRCSPNVCPELYYVIRNLVRATKKPVKLPAKAFFLSHFRKLSSRQKRKLSQKLLLRIRLNKVMIHQKNLLNKLLLNRLLLNRLLLNKLLSNKLLSNKLLSNKLLSNKLLKS